MGLFSFLSKSKPSLAADESERWLLSARCFSVLFLTGCARRAAPYFDFPVDPSDPRGWDDLSGWIAEHANALVMPCAFVRSTLETGTLDDLRKACSATHHAAYGAWPKPHAGPFRARAALSPSDPEIASFLEKRSPTRECTGYELVRRARESIGDELTLAGVGPWENANEDGAILCEELVDLLDAEWTLWGRGLDHEAGRVNLVRTLVGTAVASEWAEDPGIPERVLSAAEAGFAYLRLASTMPSR